MKFYSSNAVSMQAAFTLICLVFANSGANAENGWFPSKHGAGDTLGAANYLSAENVLLATQLVKHGKVYSLGVDISSESPPLPNGPREYRLGIVQPAEGEPGTLAPHADGRGITQGANQLTANADFMTVWMGIGTQIEGLGHIGIDNRYYNGIRAEDFVSKTGVSKFSIHDIPPIVSRGVLLNVAQVVKRNPLEGGYAISERDIRAAEKAAGLTLRKGDVVLIHTGWLSADAAVKAKYSGQQPGLGLAAARYLASKDIVAIGSDNDAVEAIPAEDPTQAFPVHTELLTKNGIYLLENVSTALLAADGATEFLFVLGQPRYVGAVQAIVNPIAIR